MKTIVWVAQSASACPRGILHRLREIGYEVVECDYGASLALACDARVLVAAEASRFLAPEYAADPRPTLILAASHSLLLAALVLARCGDDACRDDEDFEVLALRVKRVLARDNKAGEDFDASLDLWRMALPDGLVAAVMAIDLDNFLALNQRIGFARGTEVLEEVTSRVAADLTAHDKVLRRHGDDIYLLLARPDKARVVADSAAARERIGRTPIRIGTEEVTVTGSAGLAFFDAAASTRAISQAEIAMLMAKHNGRDDVVLYDTLKDANEDALTGAHSRRYFDTRLPRELRRAISGRTPLTLALLDLDDFGLVNKHYGHTVGDEVLRQFVRVVLRNVRPSDWLARYGGEEFCLVMGATCAEGAIVVERIRRAVADAVVAMPDGTTLMTTVSIGLASASGSIATIGDIVQLASAANRRAKDDGKNRVAIAET